MNGGSALMSEYGEGLHSASMVARSGKTSPILPVVEIIERRLPEVVRPLGYGATTAAK